MPTILQPLKLDKQLGVDLGDGNYFLKNYDIMQLLGHSHNEVESLLVNSKANLQVSFLKVIDFKQSMRGEQNQRVIKLMCTIRHPSIVPIRGMYADDNKKLYIVSDYIADSYQSLLNIDKVLSEAQLSLVIQKVLQVIVFLHEKKVTLNNLHPNNVFVSNKEDGDILITDVGLNQL